MKAKEYDNIDMIKKQSEFEVRMLQMKHSIEQASKDKKKAEDDLYIARDKIREILNEKIALENEVNHLERVEDSKLNDIEQRYVCLSEDYKKIMEENRILKKNEGEQKKEI